MGHNRKMNPRVSARSAAAWRSEDEVWLDHASLEASDAEWLDPVRRLTLWAVKVPRDLLSSLPQLEWLDIRGGSGLSIDIVKGCQTLTYLQVNQVRGLHDLSALGSLTTLRLLSLYGLPQVRSLPSLGALTELARLEIGSMKGISGLGPALDAPCLKDLLLIKSVTLAKEDPDAIAAHPTLTGFTWVGEDLPVKTWAHVVEHVDRANVRIMYPSDWFDENP